MLVDSPPLHVKAIRRRYDPGGGREPIVFVGQLIQAVGVQARRRFGS